MTRLLLTSGILASLLILGCFQDEPPTAPHQQGGHEITSGSSVAVSPNGIWLALARNGAIVICDTSDRFEAQLTPGTSNDSHPRWSPDGKFVSFIRTLDNSNGVARSTQLIAVDVSTRKQFILSTSSTNASYSGTQDGIWAPTSDKIAFVTDSLKILRTDGTGTLLGKYYAYQPSWSPDGMQFVCTSIPNSQAVSLFVGTVGVDSLIQIPTKSNPDSPQWLSDGNTIAYVTPGNDLVLLHLKTRIETTVATDIGHSPTVSPDGRKLAYVVYYLPGNPDLPSNAYIYCLDISTHTTVAIANANGAIAFTWSPSSRDIFFEFSGKVYRTSIPF